MKLQPLITHTGILMTFYLSIILDLQTFFHWYILQSWKLKRPQIQLCPHHFWTYTSNLTTVVKSVLKSMINGTTSVLKSYIFQICAAIYQLLLHMVFTSHNWFAMQGPVAIILISWNVISIWETGYWTRAIKRFALFDLLKSLYFDTKILSKYIPSLQKRL
jgi:ABC-type proline/glycine betaine transport system permease subunit